MRRMMWQDTLTNFKSILWKKKTLTVRSLKRSSWLNNQWDLVFLFISNKTKLVYFHVHYMFDLILTSIRKLICIETEVIHVISGNIYHLWNSTIKLTFTNWDSPNKCWYKYNKVNQIWIWRDKSHELFW